MKILINTPNINKRAGVANHFLGLKGKFANNVEYNYVGGQSKNKFFLFKQFKDYIVFIKKVLQFKPDVIHLNPSLDKKAAVRDLIFLAIAKLLRKKVLVFWHGWDLKFEREMDNKRINYIKFYNCADAFCVLSNDFKKKLREWNITKPIYIETTKIDDALLKEYIPQSSKEKNSIQILFLSRVEKEKGITETVKAFEILKKNHTNINLIIAGDGSYLNEIKIYIDKHKISNISFCGYILGEQKINTFIESDIYILPSYSEGMPTSVIEAMAFGLPVITRPVGGLKDFFENGKMGYITESKDSKVFANLIEKLISDKEKMKEIGRYNHEYAMKHFLASKVAKRLEKIYEKTYYAK